MGYCIRIPETPTSLRVNREPLRVFNLDFRVYSKNWQGPDRCLWHPSHRCPSYPAEALLRARKARSSSGSQNERADRKVSEHSPGSSATPQYFFLLRRLQTKKDKRVLPRNLVPCIQPEPINSSNRQFGVSRTACDRRKTFSSIAGSVGLKGLGRRA